MRQEEERFFQIIFEKNSHVLFRYICGQLNNDRETAKDVLNDVWEVLVVKFETVADLEGSEQILSGHLAEAISYRNLDRENWAG